MELFVVSDIRAALDKKYTLKVGLIILTLVGIECISGYFVGERAERKTFELFVASKYFPDGYHGDGIASALYTLRDGLFHDYTIKYNKFRFWGDLDEGYPHLSPINTAQGTQIVLNREAFARDFVKAWEQYSNDVFAVQDLSNKAVKRIKEAGKFLIVENATIPTTGIDRPYQGSTQFDGTVYSGGTHNFPTDGSFKPKV